MRFKKLLYRRDVPRTPAEVVVRDNIDGSYVESAVVYRENLWRCIGLTFKFPDKAFYGTGETKAGAYRNMKKYADQEGDVST